jgi:hypothetical protein
MFTKIESTNMTGMERRSVLNQKSCGVTRLQVIMIQYAQA